MHNEIEGKNILKNHVYSARQREAYLKVKLPF
jgi:hypothetical protein